MSMKRRSPSNRAVGLAGFSRDRRGVSAVEFALIAPIIIFFYFGMAEFCQAFMAQKRMGHSASMVADLVAQSQTALSQDQIDQVLDIGELIMKPFSADSLAIQVSSVTQNADGDVVVDWSHGDLPDAPAPGDVIEIPANLLTNGESLIMSEADYAYDSPVGDFMPGITHFTQVHYLRPRSVNKVDCTDCPKVE